MTPEQVIQKRRQDLFYKEDIYTFLTRLLLMILIIFLLFGVVFGITPMKDDDMKPKINSGDLMLYYRLENQVGISFCFGK